MARETDRPEKDYLRPEDRILWETVAKTAKPLARRKAKPDELPDFKSLMAEEEKQPAQSRVQPAAEERKPKRACRRSAKCRSSRSTGRPIARSPRDASISRRVSIFTD